MIRKAIEARLEFRNLLSLLVSTCFLYEKAEFKDHAKYGMLRNAALEDRRFSDFPLMKGPLNFSYLKGMMVQFVRNFEIFQVLQAMPKGAPIHGVFVDPNKNYQRPATCSAALEAVRGDVKYMEQNLETSFDNRLEKTLQNWNA